MNKNITQGEWEVEGNPFKDKDLYYWLYKVRNNKDLYQYVVGRTEEEAIANANLISAAPDLLNEAIKIVENIKDYFSDVEDINSIIPINGLVNAINKATKQ